MYQDTCKILKRYRNHWLLYWGRVLGRNFINEGLRILFNKVNGRDGRKYAYKSFSFERKGNLIDGKGNEGTIRTINFDNDPDIVSLNPYKFSRTRMGIEFMAHFIYMKTKSEIRSNMADFKDTETDRYDVYAFWFCTDSPPRRRRNHSSSHQILTHSETVISNLTRLRSIGRDWRRSRSNFDSRAIPSPFCSRKTTGNLGGKQEISWAPPPRSLKASPFIWVAFNS